MRRAPFMITALFLLVLVYVLMTSPADAVAAVDIDDITVSDQNPGFDDNVTVTADLLLVDAEVDTGDVVLRWFQCTATMCDGAELVEMAEQTDGSWSVTVGPFESESLSGDRYTKLTLIVEVQAHATDGGENPEKVSSEELVLYFDDSGEPTDDDGDDDGENNDSPVGSLTIAAGGALALIPLLLRRYDK